MMKTIEILFWIALAIVFYTYAGYGIFLYLLVRVKEALCKRTRIELPEELPEVTLLIAAYNEEAVIADKMRNCRARDYPAGRLKIVWVTDGSNDRTNELLAGYWAVKPEIMIPLVGDIKELKYVKKFVVETADAEIAAAGSDLQYEVGTMIEIPRAALTADDIAKEADFFCFGTNDLTQMTYGFSRDDAGKFLDAYYDAKIFENDPFAKLDQVGVGKLMKMAIELGKPVNPKLHVGICGEHGGDPSSVEFCNSIGLDYVSCSPFRVPIARLAAAQAAIAQKNA